MAFDPVTITAIVSSVIAAIAVFLNIRKAPAEKDSIVVQTANEAVAVLKMALIDTREVNTDLRRRIDEQALFILEQEKRIRHLEHELARLLYERRPYEGS